MRRSGILMPVFSLPTPYGIGCFSKEAREFIDFLAKAKQSYWQILPLSPTSFGDSPYQSPSAFAGNPYFIDLNGLMAEGLLTREECREYADNCPKGNLIDYGFLHRTRKSILKKAFSRFSEAEDYRTFCSNEDYWLDTYAEFAAIKEHFEGKPLLEWNKEVRLRHPEALKALREKLAEEIRYHKFIQYTFMRQWKDIRAYARERGIEIIGDMPIYTALDSAEVWSAPELFIMDENRVPTLSAGCPPDTFAKDGQLWGNPIYNWEYHKSTGYKWWAERLRHSMELYDILRIDHFRGFDSFYAIPYGSKTARCGKWYKGPGAEIFDVLSAKCPDLNIIAEDLGFITDSVRELLKATGYPGMKVMQFAFDSREESDYLPHNYGRHSVVYTGTHDNDTTVGWAKNAPANDVLMAARYSGARERDAEDICRGIIRLALGSVADICIIPLQDYLLMDSSARINTPGTLGDNWKIRLNIPTDKTAAEIGRLTELYGRKYSKSKNRKADINV